MKLGLNLFGTGEEIVRIGFAWIRIFVNQNDVANHWRGVANHLGGVASHKEVSAIIKRLSPITNITSMIGDISVMIGDIPSMINDDFLRACDPCKCYPSNCHICFFKHELGIMILLFDFILELYRRPVVDTCWLLLNWQFAKFKISCVSLRRNKGMNELHLSFKSSSITFKKIS